MTAHRSLQRSIAIGLPALVLAASCVPQSPPRVAASQVVLKPDARTLLRRLALTVPDAVEPALPTRAESADLSATTAAAPAFAAAAQSPQDFGRAEDCLTAAVYYEARSQSEDGQRAVAQVVLNRVRDLAFPASVCGVVYQGSNRRTGCQFSFTCDGSIYGRRDPWAWERARTVAAAALGGAVYAAVGSATHYHAAYVSPWWAPSLTRIAQIGAHIFYRWQNGMERTLAFRQAYSGLEPSPSWGGGGGNGAGPVTIASGAVRYGVETVLGVTVHRGDAPVPEQQSAAIGPEPAVGRAAPRIIHVSSFSGVRVHYGAGPSTAVPDRAADAGEAESSGTT